MVYSTLIYISVFALGLILGSYLNSWIWRIHEGKYVFMGRSICVHCSRELAWYENIPLFSYIFLKGRCRTCKAKIPASYFLTEIATALVFVLVAFHFFSGSVGPVEFFRNIFFSALLIVIFVYDAKYQLILPGIIWLGSLIGFIINYKYLGMDPYFLVLGALIGGGFFMLQYIISSGKWIGGGDVRLGVMMGILLGWKYVLVALLVSYFTGAIIGILLLLLRKKEMSSAVPFGTFLSLGTFASMLWGEKILIWYLGLF